MKERTWKLVCMECRAEYSGTSPRYRCECGGKLDVVHDIHAHRGHLDVKKWNDRRYSHNETDRSGVWRFREIVLPVPYETVVTRCEGNTNLYGSPRIAGYVGMDSILLKHEGENPTGSFKDRGMSAGLTAARMLGMSQVACASTGNSAAAMASYAATAGMQAIVFVPEGTVAVGKLHQSLAYGARTIEIPCDFDSLLRLVEEACLAGDIYLLNSMNPFRFEGEKTIGFELLQDLGWQVPEWVVVPGGNLGHSAALAKGFRELYDLRLIGRMPRIAVIQAAGANPFYTAFKSGEPVTPLEEVNTFASAIAVGNPYSWRKSLRGLKDTDGLVEEVSDSEILNAKLEVDAAGIGAESASCATVAGIKKLVEAGTIKKGELVCGILTGHLLKDLDTIINYHQGRLEGISAGPVNPLLRASANTDSILELIRNLD
ncbi:MAG: threonine synthase [Acidobacteria bacterium]|uniref:Threonine synthase n=1 Tax=Candidatus Polarisedimenticola svalbardensis TaxID=2886004 RepID=A0A8J6XY65_9BACT|nr:threonine synthase [Candidatus Polarisedimenticola svalbardensis]